MFFYTVVTLNLVACTKSTHRQCYNMTNSLLTATNQTDRLPCFLYSSKFIFNADVDLLQFCDLDASVSIVWCSSVPNIFRLWLNLDRKSYGFYAAELRSIWLGKSLIRTGWLRSQCYDKITIKITNKNVNDSDTTELILSVRLKSQWSTIDYARLFCNACWSLYYVMNWSQNFSCFDFISNGCRFFRNAIFSQWYYRKYAGAFFQHTLAHPDFRTSKSGFHIPTMFE